MNAIFCDVYAEKSAKQIDKICEIAEIGAVQKNAHLVRFLRTFGIVFFSPGATLNPKSGHEPQNTVSLLANLLFYE